MPLEELTFGLRALAAAGLLSFGPAASGQAETPKRGAVIGIAIGVFFAGLFLGGVLPDVVANLTPWALLEPLAMELADETRSVDSYVPMFATVAWIAVFTAASIWRFQREEI